MSSDAINVELRLSCKNTESHTSTDVSRILPCYLFPPCPPSQRTEVFFPAASCSWSIISSQPRPLLLLYLLYISLLYDLCNIQCLLSCNFISDIFFILMCHMQLWQVFFSSLFCWILASVLHTPCLCFFYENFSAFFLFGSDLLSSSLLWDKRAKEVVNFSLLMMHSMRVLQQRINAIHVR